MSRYVTVLLTLVCVIFAGSAFAWEADAVALASLGSPSEDSDQYQNYGCDYLVYSLYIETSSGSANAGVDCSGESDYIERNENGNESVSYATLEPIQPYAWGYCGCTATVFQQYGYAYARASFYFSGK